MATWRELIKEARQEANDDNGPLLGCTLTEEQLDVPFNRGWGLAEGEPFTAWTESRVYFPVVYDGAEWAGSVPRNPCDEASSHFGGQ